MRRFESDYRINEGDDVLDKENAVHRDLDLRLDDVEQGVEAYRTGQRDDIEAILASVGQTYSELAAEMRGLLDQASGGLSADIIVESATRSFLTAARRTAILGDAETATLAAIRDGVASGGDTLAKLYSLVLAAQAAASANATTLATITSGADPTLDSFAEALTRFVIDEGQISGLMTMVGNRLRLDAAGGYSDALKGQGRWNLAAAPASVSANGAFTAPDIGRKIRASGTITRTLPAISGLSAGWATGEIENSGTGIVTVAAAGADAFESVAGGTIALFPRQRAYVYLDTDGWHVGWVDRSPLLQAIQVPSGAPVGYVDFSIPVGYSKFILKITGHTQSAGSQAFGWRISPDTAANLKASGNDYSRQSQFAFGSTVGTNSSSNSVGAIFDNSNDGGAFPAMSHALFSPGNVNQYPMMTSKNLIRDTQPAIIVVTNDSWFTASGSGGGLFRAALLRLVVMSGTFYGNYSLIGEP